MMAQYFAIKCDFPGTLVFYRMGDFYELFYADAEKAAGLLGITLTQRGQSAGVPVVMAGVPVHARESYVAKLLGRAVLREPTGRVVRLRAMGRWALAQAGWWRGLARWR